MKIALRLNSFVLKGCKVGYSCHSEIDSLSISFINNGLEAHCEKNCPFLQRIPLRKLPIIYPLPTCY